MPKNILRLLIIFLCVISLPVSADGKGTTKNDCDDPTSNKEFEDLLGKHPTDTGIIRLVAIRKGLCEMIAKQQITLQTGLDLWEFERQKMLTERTKAALNRISKKTL